MVKYILQLPKHVYYLQVCISRQPYNYLKAQKRLAWGFVIIDFFPEKQGSKTAFLSVHNNTHLKKNFFFNFLLMAFLM